MPKLLVVDDEPHILGLLQSLLTGEGYEVVAVLDGAAAESRLRKEPFDLLLTDLRLKPIDGLQLLKLAQEIKPDLPVILLTGYASVESAIEAMRLGAFDYITKPFKVDELLSIVRHALESSHAGSDHGQRAGEVDAITACSGLIAESPTMKKVVAMIQRLAPTDAPVLIVGEPGTGREAVARAIHKQSRRKDQPFVRIDSAALPGPALAMALFGADPASQKTNGGTAEPSLMGQARGGTLFFDDILQVPHEVQVELVRLLREKTLRRQPGAEAGAPADVRILAALNETLEQKAREGGVRPDLYKRMSVFTIKVPPLRERREDVLLLWHCLAFRRLGEKVYPPELSPQAAEIVVDYPWPGNVPEMEAVIKKALSRFSGQNIGLEALPEDLVNQARAAAPDARNRAAHYLDPSRNRALRAFLREKEREHFEQVLAGARDRKSTAPDTGGRPANPNEIKK